MSGVRVVTDSTSYLPPEVVVRHGLEIVSLYSAFEGEEPQPEDIDGDFAPFYERLVASDGLATTQPPTVEDFASTYRSLLADGSEVVSVHISSGLSETCEIARQAASKVQADGDGGERVHVVDSATAGPQQGLLAITAARAASAGRTAAQVVDLVREARAQSNQWFMLDTLEYLRRGGRVGGVTAWIGSTLSVKPILTIASEMEAVERVRTRERAVERLLDFGRELKASDASAYVVLHTASPGEADAFVGRLHEVFWHPPVFVAEIGPVIGTHVGPGALGIAGIPPRFLE